MRVFASGCETLMAGRDWFWVAGNHDPEAPADLPGETVRELAIGSLLFRHEPLARCGSRARSPAICIPARASSSEAARCGGAASPAMAGA